jgi:hypothetical protein
MPRKIPHQTLLGNAIFWLLVWVWFNGTSARTCQLKHVGHAFDATPLADFPVSILVAVPGVFLVLLYIGLYLKARASR